MGRPRLDLTGRVFGRLTVTGFSHIGEYRCVYWYCKCECGNIKNVASPNLVSGSTISCGCQRRENALTANLSHGHAKSRGIGASRTYRSWGSMIQRTTNPNAPGWVRYGGRGITVCERWRRSFEAFLEDMGERPPGTSIDRIDPNGNYEPNNCRWATAKTQRLNQRRRVKPYLNSEAA